VLFLQRLAFFEFLPQYKTNFLLPCHEMTTAGAVMSVCSRVNLLAAAIFMILFAEVFLAGRASYAADDCLSKPNATAPEGSHWYYRLDRATRRECWYLGPEGRKVRPQQSGDAQLVQVHPSKRTAQPVTQKPANVVTAEAVATPATPTGIVPIGTTPESTAPEDSATEALSVHRPDPIEGTPSDDGQPLTRSSDAEEQPTPHAEDEMPLIWPILTPEELPATRRQPEFTASLPQVGAFLVAVLGLAAVMGRMIFKLSARRRNRSPSRDSRGSTGRADKQGTPTFANTTAATRQTNVARKTREVRSANDPIAVYESSVRRLLQELHGRQHKSERRDSKRTMQESSVA
jgi:hypothetical protein